MMRLFLGISLCLLLMGCYESERNCKDFRTGTFKFEAMVGTEVFETTIIRNDSIEIDFYQGKTDTSSIRWINDCEYIIKKMHPKNQAEKMAIHIKILSTAGDDYKFEFREVGKTNSSVGTATRVKDAL